MWEREVINNDYGNVFMVGRERGQREFHCLQKLGDKLRTAGDFSSDRLQHA